MEAKHPNQNLNNHVRRLQRYLTSLKVKYGLLTNGKQIRIYERVQDDIQLVFQCPGKEVEARLDEIKSLIGRDRSKEKPTEVPSEVKNLQNNPIIPQLISNSSSKEKRQHTVKVLAVYHNKGGVGKTTTVVNLAAAIRKKGKRVLVIDLDSQANTTFAAGLAKFEDEEFDDIKDCNIRHLLESEDFNPIQEVARQSQFNNPEISVIPSHITLMKYENELSQLADKKMMLIGKLEVVKDQYDIVILDTPPAIDFFSEIALITADYLLIPSDLKPFANQGLANVKEFVKRINNFRKFINKSPIQILGVLPCKISTNARFVQYTLPKRLEVIPKRYGLNVMDSVIYEREELAKCTEKVKIIGNLEIPDPRSVLDFKPDSTSAQEFELLSMEILQKIGIPL
jgi:cellulose biosynthesis protein BcsQ